MKILIGGEDKTPDEDGISDDDSLGILETTSVITIDGVKDASDNNDFEGEKLEVAAILEGGQVCDVSAEDKISVSGM